MRYPFVLLDAGGTLFGARESMGAVYARVLSSLGFDRPADVLDDAMERTWAEMERIVPRGADRYGHFAGGESEFWLRFARRVLEAVGGDPPPDGFAHCVVDPLRDAFREPEAWCVFPDVVPALQALLRSGARLGVVSNWDSRLPALLKRLGLDRYFVTVVVSHLEGVEKPRPEIFQKAVRDLGAAPSATLHVGDVPELDLDGARAAGIDGVLVDRRGRLDPARNALPDLSPLPRLALAGMD